MRVLLRGLLLLGAVGLASLVRFGSNDAAIVALFGVQRGVATYLKLQVRQ